jgi:hypothetical protein
LALGGDLLVDAEMLLDCGDTLEGVVALFAVAGNVVFGMLREEFFGGGELRRAIAFDSAAVA